MLKISTKPALIKPLTRACLYTNIKKFCEGGDLSKGERARYIADEFKRMAEEKRKGLNHEQGVASQTFEKASDGMEEAVAVAGDGDSKAKNRIKEHGKGSDYRKTGDNKDSTINTFKGT